MSQTVLGGSLELWLYKDAVTPHELSRDMEEGLLIWEVQKHGSHDWHTLGGGLVECCVKVVYQLVSQEHCLTDHCLDSLSLMPGVSICVVDRAVSSEEGIKHA